MAHLKGEAKSAYVQGMFGRIAERYNIMNRLMTLGQDQRWRRFVVGKASVPPNGTALDLATGTGDIAFETLKVQPTAKVIGADFALPMMFVGPESRAGQRYSMVRNGTYESPYFG